jgi:asparagine N-glycosylation enzyme membrane subunit Stt3
MMKKYLSLTDMLVITITFMLFVIALFVKGLTHDILLEAGVLLVSIKIIMMSYKNISSVNTILKELNEIKETLSEIKTNK